MSREKTHAKHNPCTRCGKYHPKGKKRRAKLKASGAWGGCTMEIKKETANEKPRWTAEELDKRAAKNAQIKERNSRRQEQKRKEAEARNAKWAALSLEEQLTLCEKHGGRAKQVEKIKAKIERRNDAREAQEMAEIQRVDVRRKRQNRQPRQAHKKG